MTIIAAIYGGLAGLVIILTSIAIFFINPNRHLAGSEWLGYLVMLLAFTLIFVGIKRYRDRDLGGVIKFLPAFGLGLLTAVFASVIYVVVWEIYIAFTATASSRLTPPRSSRGCGFPVPPPRPSPQNSSSWMPRSPPTPIRCSASPSPSPKSSPSA